jgi:uncharacterized protein YdbL (DUF1318 family)
MASRAKHLKPLTGATVLAALAAACVTINVYFPEKAVKSLSEAIEKEVNAGAVPAQPAADNPPPDASGSKPAPASNPPGMISSLFGITPVMAQEVADPEVSNPAIRKIIESRKLRVAAVNKWKASGALGENNQALLEVRSLDGVSDLKARSEIQKLVRDENADREQLFREIATAKGVDAAQLPKIRETYAKTLRERAAPGEWVQAPDGTWSQK